MIDKSILIDILALVFVVITHELAHAYVALLNGDTTAKDAGRLTLNPLKHLDLMGTLFLIVFKFGWAKPVPINISNFRDKKLGLFTVSIAGIVVNLITSIVAIFLMLILIDTSYSFVLEFLSTLAFYGVLFAVFNLIPIPPLDGSKILASLLPRKLSNIIFQYERYFYIALIGLLILNRQTYFISKITNNIYVYLIENIANILQVPL